MPITNKDILRISEPVERMYSDCTSQLLVNLCGHFKNGKFLPTGQWELEKLSELGELTQESIVIIANATGQRESAIMEAVSNALGISVAETEAQLWEAAKSGVIRGVNNSWQSSERIKMVIQNLTGQALQDTNIVNTVMLQSTRDVYLNAINYCVSEEQKLIEKLYGATDLASLEEQMGKVQRELNAATARVVTGAEARTTALRRTINKLVNEGITGYVDKAGHHWSPEAYINMDIRTTSHNAAVQGQRTRSAEYGVDTFQISSHRGARPLCAPYQGKFYCWGGRGGLIRDLYGELHQYDPISTTSYGQPAGIFGINCGHNPETFIDGYSVPAYEHPDDAQNAIEYKQSQNQRYIERQIRNEKTEALAYQAAGDEEAFKETAARIKARQEEYKKYCEANNLTPRTDRTQVHGYDRSMAAKVNAAAKKETPITYSLPTAGDKVATQAKKHGISSLKPKKLDSPLSDDEIIAKLAGGDMTKGSCSSLTYAFVGNRAGFDVLDFRGGESTAFFARTSTINQIVTNAGGEVVKAFDDFKGAHQLLDKVQEGHLYVFGTGSHAAIVRKTDGVLEYLEMQNRNPEVNVFKPLTDERLKNRFGCKHSHSSYGIKYECSSDLIDVEVLAKDKDFRNCLQYINTSADKQKKGMLGGMK